MGKYVDVPETVTHALEKFVCRLYEPSTTLIRLSELRWKLFCKKQAESEQLPPTQSSLVQMIRRANYVSRIWWQDDIAHPDIPDPCRSGWELEDDEMVPVKMTLPPAPNAVIALIKCRCIKSVCKEKSRCSCRLAGLNCTEMCTCGADADLCENKLTDSAFVIGDETDSDCEDKLR